MCQACYCCCMMKAVLWQLGWEQGEVWVPRAVPLLTPQSPTSCTQHTGQAISSMLSCSKGIPQSTKNACSGPYPQHERSLRGALAEQPEDVYSKLSQPPSYSSDGNPGTYFTCRHFDLGVLTLNCILAEACPLGETTASCN